MVFTYNNYCTLEIPCEDIFKEVMNIVNAMDSDSYTLLKSLQVGKCSKTMYNIILTLQEQVCDLAAILDETIGLEDYLDDDYE